MEFLRDMLSIAIGSFIGIIGAAVIAMWQIKKTTKLNNIEFYIQFNDAQIYINQFIEKADNILSYTETDRIKARIILNKRDFCELKENLRHAILTVNKGYNEVDFTKLRRRTREN